MFMAVIVPVIHLRDDKAVCLSEFVCVWLILKKLNVEWSCQLTRWSILVLLPWAMHDWVIGSDKLRRVLAGRPLLHWIHLSWQSWCGNYKTLEKLKSKVITDIAVYQEKDTMCVNVLSTEKERGCLDYFSVLVHLIYLWPCDELFTWKG